MSSLDRITTRTSWTYIENAVPFHVMAVVVYQNQILLKYIQTDAVSFSIAVHFHASMNQTWEIPFNYENGMQNTTGTRTSNDTQAQQSILCVECVFKSCDERVQRTQYIGYFFCILGAASKKN